MTTTATCAFGVVLPSPSIYGGEQYDSDLGLYYLRARYYNPATGRFMSRDPEDGQFTDPKTLHKYLYADGDPIDGIDPMGREDEESYGAAIKRVLVSAPVLAIGVAGTVLCTAIFTLAEFKNVFSDKEEERETTFICLGFTVVGIASYAATFF